MTSFYGEDLAYIHDTGHGAFARNAAPGLLDILRRNGVANGLVVDLGCGSGIWAAELCCAGYSVLGVDISAPILDIARRRVPQAEFRRGSLFDIPLPECAAVTSMSECLNFIAGTNDHNKALRSLFARIYQALQPGGLFVFDMVGPGRERGMPPKRWNQGDDWAVLVEAEEDPAQHTLTRRITSFRKTGELYRREEEVHRLQLYRSADIAAWLRSAGFRVRVARGYGELKFTQAQTAFIARK